MKWFYTFSWTLALVWASKFHVTTLTCTWFAFSTITICWKFTCFSYFKKNNLPNPRLLLLVHLMHKTFWKNFQPNCCGPGHGETELPRINPVWKADIKTWRLRESRVAGNSRIFSKEENFICHILLQWKLLSLVSSHLFSLQIIANLVFGMLSRLHLSFVSSSKYVLTLLFL